MACVGEGRRRKPVAIALLLSGCGAFGATPAGTSGDGDAGLPDASTSEASPPAEGGVETDGGDPCVAADLVFAVDSISTTDACAALLLVNVYRSRYAALSTEGNSVRVRATSPLRPRLLSILISPQ